MRRKKARAPRADERLVQQLLRDIADGADVDALTHFIDSGMADPDATLAFREVQHRLAGAPAPLTPRVVRVSVRVDLGAVDIAAIGDPYADDFPVMLQPQGGKL